ncbi:MAG: tetratricopeptide repeat protein [Janthinobacterium lividum]
MILPFFRLYVTLLAAPVLFLAGLPPTVHAQAPAEQLATASALYDSGKFAEAAKVLETFLAANPKHPRAGAAALALGRCRSELKQYAKAVPAYEKAITDGDPRIKNVAELGLGEAALQTEQWTTAASALRAATQAGVTEAQSPIAYDWLGQAEYESGRYATAEEAYTHVLDKYPASEAAADATFGAGLAALKECKSDKATVYLRTIVDKYGDNGNRPQALLLLGQISLSGSQYVQARDEFQLAMTASGADAETLQAADEGLVNALLKLGDNAGAETHLRAILAKMPAGDPQRFSTELTLGRSLYGQKKYAPAAAAYQVAAKSPDPKIAAQGLYWSANAALALGKSSEAAAQLAQIATRYPKSDLALKAKIKVGQVQAATKEDNATGTLQQAQIDLDAKKYAAAASALTTLLGTAPPGPAAAEAHYLLGLADQGLGRSPAAIAALTTALATGSGTDWLPDAHVQLAWLYIGHKQPAAAESSAQAALALSSSPGYSPEIEQQARLALLQGDLDQQKWDGALVGCQTLLSANPLPNVQATVIFTQAWVNEKQSHPKAALPLWQRLASDFPQSSYAPEALLHLGDASFKSQKYDEAQTSYTHLLTQYPKSDNVPQARLGSGNALYNLGKYGDAAAMFDALEIDKNAGALQPEALYWAGASWEKAGKKSAAVQRLTRLVDEFPANSHVAKAKVRLAYLKAGG